MNKEDIKSTLTQIIVNSFNLPSDDSIETLNFVDDLGMDSITFISLIVEFETSFQITIPDDMLVIECFGNFKDCYDSLCNIICSAAEEESL